MHYWLLKTEPEDFSWADLVAAGARGETWDGVRNHQAAGFLRQMKRGDRAFIYHSGKERRLVGIGEISRASYPDPHDPEGRFVAVTVRARDVLVEPVSLAAIKADAAFADFLLVRQSRLSVMPVTDEQWQRLLAMARA